MRFETQRRFTPEQEAEIVRLYATGQHSQHALARMNGCSQGTIARILKDKPEMNVAALQRRITTLEAALRNLDDMIVDLDAGHMELHQVSRFINTALEGEKE